MVTLYKLIIPMKHAFSLCSIPTIAYLLSTLNPELPGN